MSSPKIHRLSNAAKYELGVMHLDGSGNPVQRIIEGEELQQILDRSKAFKGDEKK